MRVRLKGLNHATKRLADGTTRSHWYAWRGGPKLEGQPGTPQFIKSYNEAIAARRIVGAGTLQVVIDAYQRSHDFTGLRPRTRADYVKQIKRIEAKFGDLPLVALEAKAAKHVVRTWRDELAEKSPRQADYAIDVLALILAWAKEGGLVDVNPAERMGNVYKGTRREAIWSDGDEARFMATAPPHIALAMRIALWTGQWQGDILRLTWNRYDGRFIRLQQGKGGKRLVIPVGAPLRETLEATKRTSPTIVTTLDGQAFTSSGFRASWRKARALAGIEGLTFHDLRGSAVTRLAISGCTVPEIASITGHTLAEVRGILDKHYLASDPALAISAIAKLEKRTDFSNRSQTERVVSSEETAK